MEDEKQKDQRIGAVQSNQNIKYYGGFTVLHLIICFLCGSDCDSPSVFIIRRECLSANNRAKAPSSSFHSYQG